MEEVSDEATSLSTAFVKSQRCPISLRRQRVKMETAVRYWGSRKTVEEGCGEEEVVDEEEVVGVGVFLGGVLCDSERRRACEETRVLRMLSIVERIYLNYKE